MKLHIPIAVILCASLGLCACATKNPEALAQNDPWEPTNRAVFGFDMKLNDTLLTPTAKFYNRNVPQAARDGVHNALANLNSPVVFGNNVLQGEPRQAADTFGRFVINSTVGLAGFIDVAGKMGIPGNTTDFGITLGKAGAAEGSYLVLPLLGPKPPRDLVGMGVDIAMDPLTLIIFPNSTLWLIVRGGVNELDQYAANVDQVEQIERTSIDFYATTRSLYLQSRAAQVNNGKAPENELPNF
jgi:phospholipid-binding lipoprotein MlaA